MELNVYNMAGEIVGQETVDDAVFGVPMNEPLVHQVVVAQMANARIGSANTKTRSEVAGGGRKPWRQKGTGRARQGSIRAPHWRGGGVVFGPHPRSYVQAIPRKMRRQALRCALSVRAQEGRILLVDQLSFDAPKTREAAALLRRLNVNRSALVLTMGVDANVVLSARNLPDVDTLPVDQLSVVDVLRHQYLVLPVPAIRQLEVRLGAASANGGEETAAAAAEEAVEDATATADQA